MVPFTQDLGDFAGTGIFKYDFTLLPGSVNSCIHIPFCELPRYFTEFGQLTSLLVCFHIGSFLEVELFLSGFENDPSLLLYPSHRELGPLSFDVEISGMNNK